MNRKVVGYKICDSVEDVEDALLKGFELFGHPKFGKYGTLRQPMVKYEKEPLKRDSVVCKHSYVQHNGEYIVVCEKCGDVK